MILLYRKVYLRSSLVATNTLLLSFSSFFDPNFYSLSKMEIPFEGFARIRLDNLVFRYQWDRNSNIELKPKQVAKLLKVFEAEKCRNTAVENIINTVVKFESGEKERLNLKKRADLKHGFIDRKVFYLDRFYRVAAAREFLLSGDQWWTVRLYDKDIISDKSVIDIQERYSHEQAFRNSTVFRKIRMYYLKDGRSEAKW